MTRREHARRVRVTATLSADIVKSLDEAAKRRGLPSRRRALEAALIHWWLREQRRRVIEREVEAYYRALPAAEKREDREWSRFAFTANRRLWE